jgi:rubrerythrin
MKAALLTGPVTVEDLMSQAYAMERDAEQRYLEFADILENHNNPDVALVFRFIAKQEQQHAQRIRERMGWSGSAGVPRATRGAHVPELEQAHYLMQPWHVLQLAIEAERAAHDFFAAIVRESHDPGVTEAARELQAEEGEHIAMLEEWVARVPPPQAGWDEDPDPPRYTD